MLRPTRVATVAAACAAAAVVGGGVTWALDASASSAAPAPGSSPDSVVRTALPGLTPAAGDPTLPGVATAAPPAGRVGRLAGPFDDRFTMTGLRLDDGRVAGRLRVTSDVSDLIELQVLVAWYDARGDLLGVRRWTRHTTEEHQHTGPPSEVERFAVAAAAGWRDEVQSAAVGVPVLVNE